MLALADDLNQSCAAVDDVARLHVREIERKIADLNALRAELNRTIKSCSQETVADCRIIETLRPQAVNND